MINEIPGMRNLADCTVDMGSFLSAAASFYNVMDRVAACWTSEWINVVGKRPEGDGLHGLHVGTGAGKSATGQLKL